MTKINHSDTDIVTMSFRAMWRDVKLVHRAAAAKGESTSDYMTRVVLEWAAADLGVKLAPDALMAHPSKSIAKAAELKGMTQREFALYAAREMAARELEAARSSKSEPPPSRLEERMPRPASSTRLRAQRSG